MIKPYIKISGRNKRLRQFKCFGLYQFYSICGVHKHHQPKCENCNTGEWVFLPTMQINQWFYRNFPDLWRKLANKK